MYLNNLQSYIFGGILIFMVCLVACEKSNDEFPTIEFGKIVLLDANQSVYYKSQTNNQLKLTIEAVINGFCPKGFNCLLPGYAEVKVEIESSNKQSTKFSLFYGQYYGSPNRLGFKPDTLDFNLNQKEYRAILKSTKSENDDDRLKAEIVLLEK